MRRTSICSAIVPARGALLAIALAPSGAHAVTTNWNTNASGSFTTAANWDAGVPDSDDTAVFNRGFVAYTVTFPGNSFSSPPRQHVIHNLIVRTNEVALADSPLFLQPPIVTVASSDPSDPIVIGEGAGDVGILNMTLSRLSGANASIGLMSGATGTLNVGGTFDLSGALYVGHFGAGTMNVTGGGSVASSDGFIAVNPGSSGQVTVSGANSTWTISNSLTVGGGRLDVNDGGVVSATGGLQVNFNGRLAGNGLIQGNVQNSGLIAPGPSIGTLHIDGNFSQAGALLVDLAAAESFDKLDVDGNITLDGDLHVSLLGGFSPPLGASFDILDWTGTLSGTFRAVKLPPLAGRVKWNTSQLHTSGVLSVVPAYFDVGEFITHSQDSWGDAPSPGNGAQLLAEGFMGLYGGGVEVGVSANAGYSMIFTSAGAVINYLPASGSPARLTADLIDPTSTSSGLFGGYVLALQLNVDFNDAGFLTAASGTRFGDLVLHDLIVDFGGYSVDLTAFNSRTVRQFLADLNVRLGAGQGPYTDDDVTALTDLVVQSFAGGAPSDFAQNHLRYAGDFDVDGDVDGDDLAQWQGDFGVNGLSDADGDGDSDGGDFLIWQRQLGNGPPAQGASATVPEPTTELLLILVTAGLCARPNRTAKFQQLINT